MQGLGRRALIGAMVWCAASFAAAGQPLHDCSDAAIETDFARVKALVASGGQEWSDEIRTALERIELLGGPQLLTVLQEGEAILRAQRAEALARLGDSVPLRGGPLNEFQECSEERSAVLWGSVAEQSAAPEGDGARQAATGLLARVEQALCALREAIGGIAGRAFLEQLEAAAADERRSLLHQGMASDIPRVRVVAATEIARQRSEPHYEALCELFARSSISGKGELAPILAELDHRAADLLLLEEFITLAEEQGADAVGLFLGHDPWHSPGRSGREWERLRAFRATQEAILRTGARLLPAIVEEVRSRAERPSTAALVKLLVQLELEHRARSDSAPPGQDDSVLRLLEKLAHSERLPWQVREAATEGRSVL